VTADALTPQVSIAQRWKAAVTRAAQQTLPARWRSTLAALESARFEYRRLRAAQALDVWALRKAAQRIHDLEQLRAVLSRELIVSKVQPPCRCAVSAR
jgi:hypothetical protein